MTDQQTYSYYRPEARVTQSALTSHWVVDAGAVDAQGYRDRDDALADAEMRTAHDLRRSADAYERSARLHASDPDMLPAA